MRDAMNVGIVGALATNRHVAVMAQPAVSDMEIPRYRLRAAQDVGRADLKDAKLGRHRSLEVSLNLRQTPSRDARGIRFRPNPG